MIKNNLFSTTIVFFCFLTNVYAENGHVDLKFLSENVSTLNTTQNLSGFGIEIYKNFKTETDGENYESYIEKNSREKKLEKKLYRERQEGANPKTIAKLENRLFIERQSPEKISNLTV